METHEYDTANTVTEQAIGWISLACAAPHLIPMKQLTDRRRAGEVS